MRKKKKQKKKEKMKTNNNKKKTAIPAAASAATAAAATETTTSTLVAAIFVKYTHHIGKYSTKYLLKRSSAIGIQLSIHSLAHSHRTIDDGRKMYFLVDSYVYPIQATATKYDQTVNTWSHIYPVRF